MSDIFTIVSECLQSLAQLSTTEARQRAMVAITAVLDLSIPKIELTAIPQEVPADPTPKKRVQNSRNDETERLMVAVPLVLKGGAMTPKELRRRTNSTVRVLANALEHLRRRGTVIGEGKTSQRIYRLPPADAPTTPITPNPKPPTTP